MQHTTPILFEPYPGYVLDQEKALYALENFICANGRDTPVNGLFAVSQIQTLLASRGEEISDDINGFLFSMGCLLNDIHSAAFEAEKQEIANLKAELKTAKESYSLLLSSKGIGEKETKKFFPN